MAQRKAIYQIGAGFAEMAAGDFLASQIGAQQLFIPASELRPNITNGAQRSYSENATNKHMRDVLLFDPTTQEYATADVQLPKRWGAGTFTAQAVWTVASGSGGVTWQFAGVCVSDGDAYDAAYGTAQTSADTLIAAADLHISPATSAITAAGSPAKGDRLQLQVSRLVSDANDTLAVDGELAGVILAWTADAPTDA